MANYMALALRQAARNYVALAESEELAEYNPYHDSRGRFTTAGGAGGKGGMVVPNKAKYGKGRGKYQRTAGMIGDLAAASARKRAAREGAMNREQNKYIQGRGRGSVGERADAAMVAFGDRQARAAHRPTIAGRMRKAELGTRRSPAMQRRFKSQAGTFGVAARKARQKFNAGGHTMFAAPRG